MVVAGSQRYAKDRLPVTDAVLTDAAAGRQEFRERQHNE
jgi:hypothetical protein